MALSPDKACGQEEIPREQNGMERAREGEEEGRRGKWMEIKIMGQGLRRSGREMVV